MKKALVVLSGGQDSTTCLFWALENFDEIKAVSFDYGQRNEIELEFAKQICEQHNISHQIVNMDLLSELTNNSLTKHYIEIEEKEGGVPNTFVDGRNMLFLTFAAIVAKNNDIRHVVTGVSQEDFSGYPDCRNVFIKSLNTTLNLAMDYEFELETPLIFLNKEETWKLAYDLGVFDIIKENTVTCYEGKPGAGCGECPACKLRSEGLKKFLERKEKNHE
ncbi:7-cyano-7-deazaguanine synthase QueC [Natranaerobius trueperi]|uniref:7-cyano-7-deazaguanine synthase n=1 Tax=Natranaerobius trueperi TaxID=759412 RepID=A0A226BVL1_9FIRM|nr:7-cyano-7-deazaguanine synthase QueC [Natranaerobius trueperi]OWZ83015.1 7-cyano-7-deazaguanine synthase QueC [Natranaerobius trueperi]